MAPPAASDSAVTQADWTPHADVDVDPLPTLKLPAAHGVQAVDTAAAE